MNPLYNVLGGGMPTNNMAQMLAQFKEFKNSFKGDPRAEVERLVQSGRISQAQLNHAQEMARQLQQFLN